MNQIVEIIEEFNIPILMEIILAIAVIIVFKLISPTISRIIIKIITPKSKEKKNVKTHPLYLPLKTIITFIGIFIALNIITNAQQIDPKILNITTKAIKILMILLLAKAFSEGLDTKRTLKLKTGKQLDSTTQKFLVQTLKIIIYTIAVFLIIGELGYDLTGIIAGLGIGGVMITLAAQDTAKSLIGGVAIFIDRPFKIGDYVRVGTYEGTVEDIKFRSTNIRTLDNSVLHIPNSEMSISAIINYSEMQKRRYYAKLTIELNTPLEKIKLLEERIKKILISNETIIQDTISVSFQTIADSGNEIIVIAYINETNYNKFLEIKEEINYKILEILKEEKIELAYNTQTIYVKK